MKRGTCDASYLKMSNVIQQFGTTILGSHMASNFLGWNMPSMNSILSLLRPSRTSFGLPCASQRTYESPSTISDTPFQLAQLISDVGFQNEIRIDFLRQYGKYYGQDNGVLRQSSEYYVNDPHDRYGDMRLDVENMSYEELLALEEVIGNVCTGLFDKASTKFLKQSKYFLFAEANAEKESCSISQEDYKEEDKLGGLSCGHCFHIDYIKQWLKCKNICPIYKSSGLLTIGHRVAYTNNI
ncbi:Zinc finger, RING-type [Dillenia turbinata]|uniref:RING-type E3 ubiquitin transferase n=1 Tax=Dillenia turbinata TaxID=194707 RepID=A0AAN8W5X1_9MAGN